MGEEDKGEEKVEARGKEGEKKREGGEKAEGEKKTEAGGGGEKKEEKEDEGKDGEKKKGSGGEGDGGDKKETPPAPPPEEIVMRVYMHCEGCARKVKRSLKGFKGVEEVTTDCRTHKVVVKGKVAAADPVRVVDRVEKKSGRKVELLTPIPPKPEKKEEKEEEKAMPKPEEKKEEPPVMCVVLKVHMHCEACSQEIKKRILKMKGVQSADANLKSSQVTVTGVFEPPKLVEYVYKRTGKHAVVVKAEPAEKKPDDKGKGEKKAEGGDGDGGNDKATPAEGEKKEGGCGEKEKGAGGGEGEKEGVGAAAAGVDAMAAAARLAEVTKNPLLYSYYYPRYQVEYAYAPQIFSDENPNACSVM